MTGVARGCGLPPGAYPFTLELTDRETMEPLWAVTALGPGPLNIPRPAELGYRKVISWIVFPDGSTARYTMQPNTKPVTG